MTSHGSRPAEAKEAQPAATYDLLPAQKPRQSEVKVAVPELARPRPSLLASRDHTLYNFYYPAGGSAK